MPTTCVAEDAGGSGVRRTTDRIQPVLQEGPFGGVGRERDSTFEGDGGLLTPARSVQELRPCRVEEVVPLELVGQGL
ncbi:MAG: hypothetical protein QOG88_1109, partial [Actinomycetota bacterium]|nr:hypothetical protein [Actinomycetota bacterium]